MIQLTFAPRFHALVREGLKLQSYRRAPQRIGGKIALLDDKGALLAPPVTCIAVQPIRIEMRHWCVETIRVGNTPILDLDAFAVAEGFLSIEEMAAWHTKHYGPGVFDGLLYEWAAPRRAEELAA